MRRLLLMLGVVVAVAAPAPALATAPTTVRVSVGAAQANRDSYGPLVAGNGRYVVFSSNASNLVPHDTNRVPDVFLRDRLLHRTFRVSVSSDEAQANGYRCTDPGGSFASAVTADGRYVMFFSCATNLTADHRPGVFIRDRATGSTTMLKRSDGLPFRGNVVPYAITDDGRYIAFAVQIGQYTLMHLQDRKLRTTIPIAYKEHIATGHDYAGAAFTATPLLAVGNAYEVGITLYDVHNHVVSRVADEADCFDGNGGRPYVSADGSVLAYSCSDGGAFVHDARTDTWTPLADLATAPDARVCGLSADGRYAAFVTSGGLAAADTNGHVDVYVRDLSDGAVRRVSLRQDGSQIPHGTAYDCAVSPDGTAVAFESADATVVPGDSNGVSDVFLRSPIS